MKKMNNKNVGQSSIEAVLPQSIKSYSIDDQYSREEDYLSTPLFQATLGDLKRVIQEVYREELFDAPIRQEKTGKQLYGLKAIAEALRVSTNTAQRHVKQGLYDPAIYKVGKTVVADYDKLMTILKCNQSLKYWRGGEHVA